MEPRHGVEWVAGTASAGWPQRRTAASEGTHVRLGVIASIQRGRVSVGSDFACTTEHPVSQRVFSSFARKMKPLLQAKHEKGYDAKLTEMACSASL